jgi:uncharacterized protein YjbI with pentapeptide repeats
MADTKHLKIISRGVNAWNKWRDKEPGVTPNLIGAKLSGAKLSRANLAGAKLTWGYLTEADLEQANLVGADLSWANLSGVDLSNANLRGADLSGANLSWANLSAAALQQANLRMANLSWANLNQADLEQANLRMANLSWANLGLAHLRTADLSRADLIEANICGADLRDANLSMASLRTADLSVADLTGAKLRGAKLNQASLKRVKLMEADFSGADLREADLSDAEIGWTVFGDVDLSSVKGLVAVQHIGPSSVGLDTIRESKGHIPEKFLRGCGMSPWEIEVARLYDPSLTPTDIKGILDADVFRKRIDGPVSIGGIFLCYSYADSQFVDKLHERLKESGVPIWLDRRDSKAHRIDGQADRPVRLQDVVIVVLSENSVDTDWAKHELEIAHDKERSEQRDVLCPVALDQSWRRRVQVEALWRQLRKKKVLDFSGWQSDRFELEYAVLLDNLNMNYDRKTTGSGGKG